MSNDQTPSPASEHECIFELLDEMFATGELGLYPERINYDADRYTCPACQNSMQIMGEAVGMEHLDAGTHRDDCSLVRLQQLLNDRHQKLDTASELCDIVPVMVEIEGAFNIFKLLDEMFTNGELGVYPERNRYGADCYTCPSCRNSTKIMGEVMIYERIDSGEHRDDCNLTRLYHLLSANHGAVF